MKEKIQSFFKSMEDIWGVIPSYFKVFLYAVVSSAFGLWAAGGLDWKEVAIIVATNLGIYGVPRTINTGIKSL